MNSVWYFRFPGNFIWWLRDSPTRKRLDVFFDISHTSLATGQRFTEWSTVEAHDWTMYVLNDFNTALRSFVLAHAGLDIDIKFPTVKQHTNGHVRFYSPKVSEINKTLYWCTGTYLYWYPDCLFFLFLQDLQNLVQKLTDDLTVIDRCMYVPDYFSIWLKKELWTSSVIREILGCGCKYGHSDKYKPIVMYIMSLYLKILLHFNTLSGQIDHIIEDWWV